MFFDYTTVTVTSPVGSAMERQIPVLFRWLAVRRGVRWLLVCQVGRWLTVCQVMLWLLVCQEVVRWLAVCQKIVRWLAVCQKVVRWLAVGQVVLWQAVSRRSCVGWQFARGRALVGSLPEVVRWLAVCQRSCVGRSRQLSSVAVNSMSI